MVEPPATAWRIERLSARHDRSAFDCGQPALDSFLRTLASQYEKKHMGRTYVAVLPGQPRVLGYYTVSAGAVAFSSVPASVSRKLPRHPVPVVHLGRLAVDRAARGQGLGETLLFDALRRSARTAEEMGVFAVEVYAIDDAARRFYLKYGFEPLADDPLHLYLSMRVVLATVSDSR
jgi:ribosomal protein S18 acetylase RimI-like enzyme